MRPALGASSPFVLKTPSAIAAIDHTRARPHLRPRRRRDTVPEIHLPQTIGAPLIGRPRVGPLVIPGSDRQPRVIVALHEGFYGASSGSGFSNRAFLTALTRLLPPGRLTVVPAHIPTGHPGHDRQWAAQVHRMLDAAGAEILPIPNGHALTDSVRGSENLCGLVGEESAPIAARSDRCLLIGLDVPFLGLAPYTPKGVDLLLVPRSTAALAHPEDQERIRWERAGLESAANRGSRIGAISRHMNEHLKFTYKVPATAIVDLPNGLLLQEEPHQMAPILPLPLRARGGFLFALGRPVPEKGFQDLLYALQILRDQHVRVPHLVLAATTPGQRENRDQAHLASTIGELGLDATLLTHFSPAIRSWLHSPALRAVVVPSRKEPFGRIPLEAFAAQAGPVVATRTGGLLQTVLEGRTGFTAAPGDPTSLAAAIQRALTVMPRDRIRLVRAGTALLTQRHDYLATIGSLLAEQAPWALVPAPATIGGPR
ncbi:glycosyltransferase family 4 protein [Streptomyces sp. H39-C1]|uniref:glycosyltransferase family 4 protein n=1 Tax=Streptomyces sp. H39-C1 TaxID=3004355 RepID=UPI0022B02C98|nr:glycosyltransferase family 4 protein [Streptomyces sp. H39-C1]MCZ4100770.1 glycosyltransferase family 4 protein [Streptomyces sp. H39-C1]